MDDSLTYIYLIEYIRDKHDKKDKGNKDEHCKT